jgi:HlyD family secretion protein
MFKLVRNIFALLTPAQKRRFFYLQFLVVAMSVTEIFGVASIIPFMTLVGDMDQLKQDTIIAQIYQASGIASESEFVFLLGLCVLIMLFISSVLSMFTIWRLLMFANKIGMEIADRLYSHYLKQDWLFHASGSSAQLTKKIATEITRVIAGILMPLMHMNAKIVFSFLMSISLFLYDPKVAITGLSVFAIAYFFLFRVVRMRLYRNGLTLSEVNERRFRLMNEGFGGIKDILLLGRDSNLINNFYETGLKFAYSNGNNATLSQVPRYFMELVAFGSMILLILYLLVNHSGNLGIILPILSVYALASIKLLPSLQQIYTSFAIIRANIAAFESIKDDLIDSVPTKKTPMATNTNHLSPKKNISLENVSFQYPGKLDLAISNVNISIEANSLVGIVGPSGSGKSTLIDILLGLIKPNQGQLKIDNIIVNNENRRSWQNTIGFVAQSIFLSEGTIAENVAFGVPDDQINLNQVEQALKLAHLTELVRDLEDGIHTKVGERGVKLSGGQRQRIGIARALYHRAEVLIFDEATSSLDGITEKMIMEAIHDFSGKKTIILIAHRLKTIEKCDNIFFIDEGRIDDQGTYQELIERNEHFKKMADHA